MAAALATLVGVIGSIGSAVGSAAGTAGSAIGAGAGAAGSALGSAAGGVGSALGLGGGGAAAGAAPAAATPALGSAGALGTMPLAEAALAGNIAPSALGATGVSNVAPAALGGGGGGLGGFLSQQVAPFLGGVVNPAGGQAGQSVIGAISGKGPTSFGDVSQFLAQQLIRDFLTQRTREPQRF